MGASRGCGASDITDIALVFERETSFGENGACELAEDLPHFHFDIFIGEYKGAGGAGGIRDAGEERAIDIEADAKREYAAIEFVGCASGIANFFFAGDSDCGATIGEEEDERERAICCGSGAERFDKSFVQVCAADGVQSCDVYPGLFQDFLGLND